MLLNIQPGACPGKTCLSIAGRELPWRRSCRYLGLLIDRHLTWRPALKAFCRQATRVRGAIQSLLSGGNGITPQMGLRFFQATAGAQFLYALPLVQVTINQQLAIERSQRAAVHLCLGLLRGSQIPATLVEAGVCPMVLHAQRPSGRHSAMLSVSTSPRTDVPSWSASSAILIHEWGRLPRSSSSWWEGSQSAFLPLHDRTWAICSGCSCHHVEPSRSASPQQEAAATRQEAGGSSDPGGGLGLLHASIHGRVGPHGCLPVCRSYLHCTFIGREPAGQAPVRGQLEHSSAGGRPPGCRHPGVPELQSAAIL
ncbi:uncharacterized protein LOC144115085 isoform X1 [Amblyomma americanum]